MRVVVGWQGSGRCPGPLDERATHQANFGGWGSRIRTSAYRSRVCRPTTRRIPTVFAVYQESASRIKAVIGESTALQTREPPIPSTGSIPGRPGEEVRAPIGDRGIGGRVWVCPPALNVLDEAAYLAVRGAGVRQPLLQLAKQQPYELLTAALGAAALQVGGAAGTVKVAGYGL